MVLIKLRETRITKGVSQTYMAKRLGYKSVSGYANIEMGRTNLSLKKAKQIADILNIDVKELFFEDNLHVKGNRQFA